MTHIILIALLICGCQLSADESPTPNFCGGQCISSFQCGDLAGRCRFCSGGTCTNILPAEPVSDAGVIDADTKGTL